jgi:hypothetical protein
MVAFAVIHAGLAHFNPAWLPGLGWGAAGGFAYALSQFIADYWEGFPEGRRTGPYLGQVAARVILGAIVGAAALVLGEGSAFISGLAGPAALVALGARFGRRRPPRSGRKGISASDPPDDEPPP